MALIPNIVDQRAQTDPEALYAEYPISTASYKEGYSKIDYRAFANAVNGVAWWLDKTIGRGNNSEMLAYIGPNDIRYPALVLGAVKAGYTVEPPSSLSMEPTLTLSQMFLTSPRNSVAAQIALFDQLKCKTLLAPLPRPPPIAEICSVYDVTVMEVPSAEDLLQHEHPHFPFERDYNEIADEPLFAVHTSGSTGIPKSIIYTHKSAVRNMNMLSLAPPAGYESQDKLIQGKRVFITFPPFHGAYIVSHLFNAIPFGTVMIAPTSGAIPTAEGLVEALKQTPADIAFLVPSIVQELSANPVLLDYCARSLETIIYCGGDLPQPIGDVVCSKIRLLNQFGATELGLTPNLLSLHNRSPEDWKFVEFHPDLGIEFRHVAEDMHELYVVRDKAKEATQPTFTLFPDLDEYGSRDLFMRHPSKDKAQLWSWRARADDIIVFLNGEKTNPISMEQYIVTHSREVNAALVIGAQRFQAALLIEPAGTDQELSPIERAKLLELIWPTVEEANRDAPSHARIVKSHIIFTQPKKPILRAGKGTIQRSGTLKLYADEIESLYADAEKISGPGGSEVKPLTGELTERKVSDFLRHHVSSITNWKEYEDTDDFFNLGMDSLHALLLVRIVRHGLGITSIAPSTIYTNPSISTLSKAVLHLCEERHGSRAAMEATRSSLQAEILETYRSKIDHLSRPKTFTTNCSGHVVLLTGSTGALGSHLLDRLLSNTEIAHVYCLNRRKDSGTFQLEKNQSHGLAEHLPSARTTFLTADLSQKGLGLESEILTRLKQSITLVIHNAWPVNFNLNLQSFRPQLDGLVNLIELVTEAPTCPALFFISSISSVMSHRSPTGRIPEQAIQSNTAPAPNGYAESKHVAEVLLEYAGRQLGIPTSFARAGQIAGAVQHRGVWNKAEWLPSLVLSSLHIGAIPHSLGPRFDTIDWVPIDLLAEILLELALQETQRSKSLNLKVLESNGAGIQQQNPISVFHPLNPHPVRWDLVRDTVLHSLESITQTPMEVIPLTSWLEKVRQDSEAAARQGSGAQQLEDYVQRNPAVKLLGFYDSLLDAESYSGGELEIEGTLARSEKMRALEGVSAEWVRKWVREWMSIN